LIKDGGERLGIARKEVEGKLTFWATDALAPSLPYLFIPTTSKPNALILDCLWRKVS